MPEKLLTVKIKTKNYGNLKKRRENQTYRGTR
jgi:hypothetical protein